MTTGVGISVQGGSKPFLKTAREGLDRSNKMKKVFLVIMMVATNAVGSDWVTTVDGEIYITPVPADCVGCAIEFVAVHGQDRWVELRTDRIFKDGF